MSRVCDSCGADEPVLYGVRRRYVTPHGWETPGSQTTLEEIEHWCFACCAHYPHEPVSE